MIRFLICAATSSDRRAVATGEMPGSGTALGRRWPWTDIY
jgi:hypothetical protein